MTATTIAAITIATALACGATALAVLPDERIIEGPARVIDGDTLAIRGERVRLAGIDAPESSQWCSDIPCGRLATDVLRTLAPSTITCHSTERDRYGRELATCFHGTVDINREMVRLGYAVAYRRYSQRYVNEENEARAAQRGIWSTRFVMPEVYRHGGTR